MAKASLASERRVDLRVSDETSLDRLDPEDSADVATVVGNLVDNAHRRVSRGPRRPVGRASRSARTPPASRSSCRRLRPRRAARGRPGGVRPRLHHQGRDRGRPRDRPRAHPAGLPAPGRRGRGSPAPRTAAPLRRPARDRPRRRRRSGDPGPGRRRRLHGRAGAHAVSCPASTASRWSARATPVPRPCGAAAELAPDLVLLDLYLPDRFGLDVLADLRAAAASATSWSSPRPRRPTPSGRRCARGRRLRAQAVRFRGPPRAPRAVCRAARRARRRPGARPGGHRPRCPRRRRRRPGPRCRRG